MRVLYVLNYPWPGGPVTSLLTLLKCFDPAMVHPVIYAPGPAAAAVFRRAGFRVVLGPVSRLTHFVYFVFRGRDWLVFLKELLLLPFHALRLAYVLVRFRCDIVHLNEGDLLPAAAIAKLLGKKVVWHLRSVVPADDGTWRVKLLVWGYRTLCDALLAIDGTVFEPVRHLPNAQVVNNPVDVEVYRAARANGFRARFAIARDVVCVAMIGRALPTDGLHEFVKAAEHLRDQGRADVRFLWLGADGTPGVSGPRHLYRMGRLLGLCTGATEQLARELVRARQLEDTVIFLPFQRDIASVYKELDIVVTGGEAGIGRQAMEAGAANRPVIGLSNVSSPDLVQDGVNGFVVPLGRADVLADRIRRLADDQALRQRMGERGFELACERVQPQRVAQRLLHVYHEVCGRQTGPTVES